MGVDVGIGVCIFVCMCVVKVDVTLNVYGEEGDGWCVCVGSGIGQSDRRLF